jgi:hypothetical protein
MPKWENVDGGGEHGAISDFHLSGGFRCGSKNQRQKDMYLKEIGPQAQNLLRILI